MKTVAWIMMLALSASAQIDTSVDRASKLIDRERDARDDSIRERVEVDGIGARHLLALIKHSYTNGEVTHWLLLRIEQEDKIVIKPGKSATIGFGYAELKLATLPNSYYPKEGRETQFYQISPEEIRRMGTTNSFMVKIQGAAADKQIEFFDADRRIAAYAKYCATETKKRPAFVPVISPVGAGQSFEVVNVIAVATEKNKSWWRWSYKVTVKNNSGWDVAESVKVQFLNAEGYEVEDASTGRISVPARSSKTITGSALINVPQAATVTRTVGVWNP